MDSVRDIVRNEEAGRWVDHLMEQDLSRIEAHCTLGISRIKIAHLFTSRQCNLVIRPSDDSPKASLCRMRYKQVTDRVSVLILKFRIYDSDFVVRICLADSQWY